MYTQPQLKPMLSGGSGAITLDRLTGIPFWALATAFAVLWIGMLVAIESWRSWREDLGPDHDGDFGEPPARPGVPGALKGA